MQDLAQLLEKGKQLGYHTTPDCYQGADQLLSMWKGMAHLRQEMCIAEPLSQKEAIVNIRSGIEMLLRAYPPSKK